jgi:3-oxoacyl-[acyl-carrier-protein] synthase-3
VIGLSSVAYYLPEERIDNLAAAGRFGIGESQLQEKIGFRALARKPAASDTSDLAVEAARRLLARADIDPARVQLLVLVTQNPDGRGLPQTSAIVHAKLGLPQSCASFDISLGCSGFVYGLATAAALMEASGITCGVLVTADPYSKIVDPADRDTALLFGDGAAAALLTDRPQWRIGRCDFGTQGSAGDSLKVGAEGRLHMNGRGVFNFSATEVPGSIRRALERNALTLPDVDRFLLHQGSRYIVETVARRLGIVDRAAFCAQDYGNLISSSIPVAFAEQVRESDRRVVICGFGVGLSWATTALTRVDP